MRKLNILLTCAIMIIPLNQVLAQEAMNCKGRYPDENQLVIDCSPGYATDNDRITIYSPDGFDANEAWDQQLNFSNSTWIFESTTNGRVTLLIHFYTQDGTLVAELYDDHDGDGSVAYQLEDGVPKTQEPGGRWTVQVRSPDGQWEKDGKTNFNLDLLVDGPVRGNVNSDFRYDYRNLLKNDGIIDFEIYVRDTDIDGSPDYEWRQDRAPLPEDPLESGQFRTEITHNTEDDEVPLSGSLFWPYLSQTIWGYGKTYNQSLPPIQIDWEKGRIIQIGEVVASRGNPGNYFVYSIRRVIEGKINTTDFENPFAFYDLANAKDGWPDTVVRVVVKLPEEFPGTSVTDPVLVIQYAWDQAHDHGMDYQVSMAIAQPYEQVIQFPEFGIKAVSFDKLPAWAVGQAYPGATFVQVYKQPYWTAEAIYEYTIEEGIMAYPYGYMIGVLDEPPVRDFSQVPPGTRGEYSFELNDHPWLYYSSVDHQLHLRGAQAGTWQIDGKNRVKYFDSDGDRYLDHWIHEIDGSPVNQLFQAGEFLIFGGQDKVLIKRTGSSPILFETLPPTSHAEWTQLGTLIEENEVIFTPGDFQSMLDYVPGEQLEINQAQLSNFRYSESEFRFILTLMPGNHCSGESISNLCSLYPGRYLVKTGAEGNLLVEPAIPAQLSLEIKPFTENLSTSAVGIVKIGVENQGTEDVLGLTLVISAENNGRTVKIAQQEIDAFAEQKNDVRINWQPIKQGDWILRAELQDAQGKILTSENSRANVLADPSNVISLSIPVGLILPIVISLSLFAGILSILVYIIQRDINRPVE